MAVGAGDYAKDTRGLIHGGRRVAKVGVVGGIEEIPAELEGLVFLQDPVLHDRCIDVKEAGSPVGVSAGVAEAANAYFQTI